MTIMDTVFNNKAGIPASSAKSSPSASFGSGSGSSQISSISLLPPEAQVRARHGAKMGTVWAFISILPFMWLCVLAASWLGNVRITRKKKVDKEGGTDFSENVTEQSFLGAFFGRRFGRRSKKAGAMREEENGIKGEAEKTVEVEAPSFDRR